MLSKRLAFLLLLSLFITVPSRAAKVSFDANHVMLIDGKPTFVISVTMSPEAGAVTPEGEGAYKALRAGGVNLARNPGRSWSDAADFTDERARLDAAANAGIYCWLSLRDAAVISTGGKGAEQTAKIHKIVEMFKNHPALAAYKASDEPAWGKLPLDSVVRAYQLLRQLDPNHPVIVLHAPRNEIAEIRPYLAGSDVTGADIFPIGYPPGNDSRLPNKELSCVADYTQRMMEIAQGRQPVWMTLQIAWSGVTKPGKTLRFPTFAEQRYMTYATIINGAVGINYFGATIPQSLNERDAKLGWNWTFWDRVLKPVIEEINDKSPLSSALVVPNASLPVKIEQANSGVDFCVRETSDSIYLLAAKREGETVNVKFTGLPVSGIGQVLYEAPRTVQAADGAFTDWFGPHEVHVYRFAKGEAHK